MEITVCLHPVKSLRYLQGGGHLWCFLNWAEGLQALGCRVIWLDEVPPGTRPRKARAMVATLKGYLEPHGLAGSVALYSGDGRPPPRGVARGCLDLDAASEADLLLNMRYDAPPEVVARFRRSALVDIDPGLLQVWIDAKLIRPAPHDLYFTTGETVGQPGALFPDCGLSWDYTPPPVHLPAWPPSRTGPEAPYTTVSQWWGEHLSIHGEPLDNSKRASFLGYLDLPSRSPARLELALCLGWLDGRERRRLERLGWGVRSAWDEVPTPEDYRSYVLRSRGEFSCAKPSCMRLQNAWVSDRTLCYLAAGKPAVVQHTGPSRTLPDGRGLFRFRSPSEALHALNAVEADYERQSALARELAAEHFDARKVVARVLERALN